MNYKTLSRFVALLTLPLLVCSAFAATHKPELPNFDKRAAKVLTMSAARKAEADTIASKVKDAKVSTDPISGGPSFVGSTREFLTGKNGKGKSVSDATADSIADNDPHKPAKTFLKEHTAMFGFGPEALDAAKVNKDYMTKAGNFRTVIWQQHIDDIPVFEGTFKAHWTADGQLINVSSQFISGLAKASGKVANRKTLQSNPPISAKQAIVLAAANIGDTVTTSDISEVDQPQGNEKKQHFRGGKVLNDVHARLTWMPLDDSTVQLCWQVVLVSRARGEMFSVLVDAQNGNIWLRQSLTFYLSPVSLNVFTGDSPTPFSPSWSTPNTNQPAVVSRTLTSISAISSTGSPDGWINDGDNTTAGNNVDAHLDVNNDDIADDGSRPVGNPARVFDFPLDLSQEPSTYHQCRSRQFVLLEQLDARCALRLRVRRSFRQFPK